MKVFHIISREDMNAFKKSGTYEPASLLTEGFIHCSTGDRVAEVADDFYRGREDLLLLEIEVDLLASRLVFEPALDRAGSFPHIYGPLNLDAVVGFHELSPGQDGRFGWAGKQETSDSEGQQPQTWHD